MIRLNESPLLKSPDGNTVILFQSTVVNKFASERQGRIIHDRVLMAEVIGPGSSGSAVSKPIVEIEREANVLDEDGKTWIKRKIVRGWMNVDGRDLTMRDRYLPLIEAYERNQIGTDLTGTPLEHSGLMEIERVADFKARGVHTLEALRDIPDSRLAMGERSLREQAKNLLEAAAGRAPLLRLTNEVEELRAELARKDEQINELIARMDAHGIKGADVSTETKGPITSTETKGPITSRKSKAA